MLVVDIGNTRIKWGIWDADGLSPVGAEDYHADRLASDMEQWFGSVKPQQAIFVSSVASQEVNAVVNQWFEVHWQQSAVFVKTQPSQLGVVNSYQQAEQMGVDRWVAMLAARAMYPGQAICIIDAGTAVTVDILAADGQHLGGLIMPGMALMRQSLYQRASALRNMAGNEVELANNTADAVHSGCLALLGNGLSGLYRKFAGKIDGELVCLITGGDGKKIAENTELDCYLEPNLILYGLRLIAESKE
ncbi:MAG: type III pantothenate kinase [Gammaproteobacteria bacterium]|nr:type III pantothenate kinase [Gammaproteobacteria bacterium]